MSFLKKIFICVFFLAFNGLTKAQKAKLLAGPLCGSITSESAKVWICYKGEGNHAVVLLDTVTNVMHFPKKYNYINDNKNRIAITFEYNLLPPDRSFIILVQIDGKPISTDKWLRTQPISNTADFNFLIGSCALMNTGITRSVFPGNSDRIFKSMENQSSDFMVWMGDNVYYFGKQYTSFNRMFKRNLSVRMKFKKYHRFLTSIPHYAIWDDHDFGPNNSGKDFPLKDTSLAIFKGFWPNTYPENTEMNGNFFSFNHQDCEFFMMDCRYFREQPNVPGHVMLGEKQLSWLKSKLMLSTATFKFICIGTQVLNTSNFDEDFLDYPEERQSIIDFVTQNNIKGVLFFSGDKHYSEVSLKKFDNYPFYDFTCSPLTSPVLPRKLFKWKPNDTLLKDLDYGHKNFGKISVFTNNGERCLKIQIFSVKGELQKEHSIRISELQKLTEN